MRVGASHLTYCMNVHPGESLADTSHALRIYTTAVQRAVADSRPFGVGLRIAGAAALELESLERLSGLHRQLNDAGMYVFTVNGFPYGAFHGRPVKQQVYQPDWSSSERVAYTKRIADALSRLLPEGVNGTISTVPLAYASPLPTESRLDAMASNVLSVVEHLWHIEQRTGACITLALEPEPDCILQTSADVVTAFEQRFYAPGALRALAGRFGVGIEAACELCARYLGVCLDTCHAAVEFEAADDLVSAFRGRGVTIAKVQLSSGLRVPTCGVSERDALSQYDEPVYLHQVVVRRTDGSIIRYPDLGEALRTEPTFDSEWRVHFHVPLHVARYPLLGSTRGFVEDLLRLHRAEPVTEHLEVETYTWDVLPTRPSSVVDSISQELSWVLSQL